MTHALISFLVALWLVIGTLMWAFYQAMWEGVTKQAFSGRPGRAFLELLFCLALGPLVIPFVMRRLP